MKRTVLRWLLVLALVLPCMIAAAFAEGDTAVAAAAEENVVLVIDTYAVTNPATGKQHYYARGLKTNGKEVNTLIGIEGCVDTNPSTEDDVAYTDITFAAAFKGDYVTFALSRDTAQMEAGVMVARIYESTIIGYRVVGCNILFTTFTDAAVYADAYFGGGNWDASYISTVQTPETDIRVVRGYIVSNQAVGEDFTSVSGVCLNIETGLDMLGHFVTVYYSEAYKNEYNPGTVFALVDEADYVVVKEDIDTRSDYLAAFGKKVECDGGIYVLNFDGTRYEYNIFYDVNSFTASAATYVISRETGRVFAAIAPISYRIETVSRVTNTVGKECIKIGTLLYSNTADDDYIVEYPGIVKGDIVAMKNIGGMVYVEKLTAIPDQKVTKNQTKDGKCYTYLNGTAYELAGVSVSAVDGMVATAAASSEITYDAYIYDGKLIGLIETVKVANLSDTIYVVGTYEVDVAGAYAKSTHYYAQGVDMTGKEVSVLIGVEGCGEYVVTDLPSGFYTFKLSTAKEEAQKNIMVATAVQNHDTFNSDYDEFFVEYVTRTLNYGVLNEDDMFVYVGDYSRVMLTEQTKFILVDAESIGSELNIATYTGSIDKNVAEDYITVAATVDEFGNYVAEVVVLETCDMALRSDSYIYVVDGSDYSAVECGFEYTVFFTETNEFKTIITDCEYESGFYGDWVIDEDGIYDLGSLEAYEEVCLDQEVLGCFGGTKIISNDIDLYDATSAVVCDVRSEDVLEEADVAELETLKDILSAHKAGYRVFFHALVDVEDASNPVVTHIFVYSVEAGEVDGGSTEPPVSNLPSAIYVVDTYSVEVAGAYTTTTHYYAQGVDMTGKEVSMLIGVEDLGANALDTGFYTFELSADKAEAQKNIMVATAVPTLDVFDSDVDGFFAEYVTGTQNYDVLTEDDMYVFIGDSFRVMLTKQTKFILVDAESIGSELNIATYTGSIDKNIAEDYITVAATVDEFGNYVAEVVVLETDHMSLKSSSYIYVVDGCDYAAVADGYEYTVFFTDTNEFKTIVTDCEYETGFYGDWVIDEDGIYDLGSLEAYEEVRLDQELMGFFNGRISSQDIDLYDATGAVIYDMRMGRGFSEVSLNALADALKAERCVRFHALVDTDDVNNAVVTHMFVYAVEVLDEYGDYWYEDEEFNFICDACVPVVGRDLGNGTHAVTCRYCGTAMMPEEHVYQDGVCACGALEAGQPDVPPAEISARFVLNGGLVRAGDTIQVDLFLSASVPVNSIAVSGISYDSSVLTFTGFSDHEHMDDLAALPPAFDEEKGAIVIGLRQAQIFDGKICSLNFKVNEDAPNCDVSIAGTSVVKNGSVIVGSSVAPATVLVRQYLPGDINGDEAVTLEDAVLLFQNSMLPELYPVDYPGDMDFNGDGDVDLDDAVYLFNYSMLPDLYPLQ